MKTIDDVISKPSLIGTVRKQMRNALFWDFLLFFTLLRFRSELNARAYCSRNMVVSIQTVKTPLFQERG